MFSEYTVRGPSPGPSSGSTNRIRCRTWSSKRASAAVVWTDAVAGQSSQIAAISPAKKAPRRAPMSDLTTETGSARRGSRSSTCAGAGPCAGSASVSLKTLNCTFTQRLTYQFTPNVRTLSLLPRITSARGLVDGGSPVASAVERQLLDARAHFDGAEPALEQRPLRRVEPVGLLLAGDRPGPAHVPAHRAQRREVGVLDALAEPFVGHLHVLGLHAERAGPPAHLEAEPLPLALHVVIRRVESRPERPFRRAAPSSPRAGRSRSRQRRRANPPPRCSTRGTAARQSGPPRVRPPNTRVESLRPRVGAVVLEAAELIAEDALDDAAVHHPADVASRRERAGGERPIHEVEVGGAGVLVEAERQLELPVSETAPRRTACSSRTRPATDPRRLAGRIRPGTRRSGEPVRRCRCAGARDRGRGSSSSLELDALVGGLVSRTAGARGRPISTIPNVSVGWSFQLKIGILLLRFLGGIRLGLGEERSRDRTHCRLAGK